MILNYIENQDFVDYKNDQIHEVADIVFLYHLWRNLIHMIKKRLMDLMNYPMVYI